MLSEIEYVLHVWQLAAETIQRYFRGFQIRQLRILPELWAIEYRVLLPIDCDANNELSYSILFYLIPEGGINPAG